MTPNANWFAYVALLSWPLVALWLFHARPVNQATIWTILGAQLLLPVGAAIKFEMVPAFDKYTISNLAAFVGCLLVVRRSPRLWHGFGLAGVLMLMYLASPFITAELNGDPIFLGNRTIPGEGHYDALSAVVGQFLFFLPFFLGRQVMRTSADHEEILRVLVIAGLLYSVPMLFEVRMSPQLHTLLYGYFPHAFDQQYRDGGFRPVVFMGHGLIVAFFTMTTAVAAAALWRTRTKLLKFPPPTITIYLSVMLVLCKSMGALLFGALLVPLVRWTRPMMQMRVAMVLAGLALVYPVARIVDVVPTTSMVEVAGAVSVDRATSLRTRFDEERPLLERASQRLVFGWGRWGRNRVFDEETGRDLVTTDGRWIITIGQFGLFGFLAEFGLLALPVFRAAGAIKYAESWRDKVFLAALALIISANIVELLPNATLSPWTWLLAGALLGRAELLRSASKGRIGSYAPKTGHQGRAMAGIEVANTK